MITRVIGYCSCANCGWTTNKFNWHVIFRCPECGCTEYKKWRDPFENEESVEKGTGRITNADITRGSNGNGISNI